MRLMHVISGLGTGGAESFLATLAPKLSARGITQHVVSLSGDGPIAARIEASGIGLTLANLRGLDGLVTGTKTLVRAIKTFEPDAIQGWMYHGDLFATIARRLSNRPGARLFWGVRCSDMNLADYPLQLKLTVKACAWLSRSPEAIIVNSEAGARAHKAYGYDAGRMRVQGNGVNYEVFKPDLATRAAVRAELGLAADDVVAVSVARVDPMKDHATLLQALAEVPGAKTILVGLGTDGLVTPPGVKGLGRRSDVSRILCAGDIIVSSSAYGEGFPNAIAEGMSSGLLPVATDVGDSAVIVGACGTVVPPRDAPALASALRRACGMSADERLRAGAAARARIVERFSLEAAVQGFVDLYTSASELRSV